MYARGTHLVLLCSLKQFTQSAHALTGLINLFLDPVRALNRHVLPGAYCMNTQYMTGMHL